ncbi:MAG: hypothetical protein R3263_13310 [Myxococcota bacterium]|nr:hypothetical protein [Myxococcota bacterium]
MPVTPDAGPARRLGSPTAPDHRHAFFGAAPAELQQALPGALRSPRPGRWVLDRRPFI